MIGGLVETARLRDTLLENRPKGEEKRGKRIRQKRKNGELREKKGQETKKEVEREVLIRL